MNFEHVMSTHLPQIRSLLRQGKEPDLRHVVIEGGSYPEEYIELRRQIYCNETQWLSPEELFDVNDAAGKHILIYDRQDTLVAATTVTPAAEGDYAFHSGMSRQTLSDAVFSTRTLVRKEFRRKGLMALLVYLAMREGRMQGFRRYVGYVEPGPVAAWKLIQYEYLDHIPSRRVRGVDGSEYEVVACWGYLDDATIRAFAHLPEELQIWVRQHCFVEELVLQVGALVSKFYRNPFFDLVRENRLSRQQYVESLSNKHHFVRHTTRILGRAVGISADADIRKHYAEHLSGEINHEAWIENDLRYLGVDVDYATQQMVPDLGVLNFCFVQEALTSSRLDPIAFLGVPIAIESASAFLDAQFVSDLKKNISRWGYGEPSKACTFFASHVHTDGAEDGHWIRTLQMLGKNLKTEAERQYISRIICLVMHSLEMAYTGYSSLTELRPELQ